MQIRNLATHPNRYITIAELASYWSVSRQQIYKLVESGALGTIRLGTRLYRIPTQLAVEFERQARVHASTANNGNSARGRTKQSDTASLAEPAAIRQEDLPTKFGLRRVNGTNG
jgi:excisionase family DNA binding protein